MTHHTRPLLAAAVAAVLATGCATVTPPEPVPATVRVPDYGIAIIPEDQAPGWRLCRNCTRPYVSPKTPVLPPSAVALAPLAPAEAPLEQVDLSAAALFAHDSAALTGPAHAAIEAVAVRAQALIDGDKRLSIEIHGYTDNTGTMAVNAPLAQARADAVAGRLRLALPDVAISATGRPLCCYVADNRTPDGRAANRRVTVALYAAPVPAPVPDPGGAK